jgi:Secretion system C-terminal sorting domain
VDMYQYGYWTDDRCGISNNRIANYKQDICMVTIDSATQNNMLVWENKYNYQTESFNIYREGVIANQFDSIGNVFVSSISTFVDNDVNPNQRSYRYIMSAVDSSGHSETIYNPTYDSAEVHATIHVQASAGLQGEVNLAWNAYVGFTYNTFYIYRGASSTNLQILDSVPANTFAYTDFTPPAGINYYKVAVHRTGGCSPDGGTTVYMHAVSNPPYALVLGIDNPDLSNIFLLGPNPFSEEILLRSKNNIHGGMVNIYNSLGKKVYEEEFNGTEKLIKHSFTNGLYTLNVSGTGVNYTRKIVKE